MNEERVYNELKCLNKNYNNLNVSNARGEEELKGIHEEFKRLNGSVKKHESRIGKIEKKVCYVLGAIGMLSIIWTIFVAMK